jgi:hypothetical protein
MRFLGEEKSSDPNILVYKFKDIKSSRGVYAVWAKTSKDYKADNFPLPVSPGVQQAQMVSLLAGSLSGEDVNLKINGGKVFLDVSERPVFVTVDRIN